MNLLTILATAPAAAPEANGDLVVLGVALLVWGLLFLYLLRMDRRVRDLERGKR